MDVQIRVEVSERSFVGEPRCIFVADCFVGRAGRLLVQKTGRRRALRGMP